MGAFIAKQPNGFLCRYDTTIDAITDYNITEEEYIELCVERAIEDAREQARNTLERHVKPFDKVLEKMELIEDEQDRQYSRYLLKEMGYKE